MLFRPPRRRACRPPSAGRSPASSPRRRSSSCRSRTRSSRPTYLPAGATVSVTASPAKGLEATVALCEALQARGFRAVPAPVRADGPRPRPPAPTSSLARGRRRRPRLRRRRRRQGAGRLRRRAGAAARDGRDRPSARARSASRATRRATRSSRTGRWPRRSRAKAAFASYMTTQLCFDPVAIGGWLAARRAEGLPLPVHIGLPGRRRAAQAAGDHRPDRRRRHASVPDEERAVRRAARPLGRVLPARRPARGPRAGHRGPGDGRRRPPPLHLQQRRGDRGVAARSTWRGSAAAAPPEAAGRATGVPFGVGRQRFVTAACAVRWGPRAVGRGKRVHRRY